MDVDLLACRYVALRNRRSRLAAETKKAKEEESEIIEKFRNFFETSGLKSVKSRKGPTVFNKEVLRVWVLDKMEPTVHRWLEENGYGEYVKPRVNKDSLTALIRERLQSGAPVPTCIKYAYEPDVGYASNGYTEEA